MTDAERRGGAAREAAAAILLRDERDGLRVLLAERSAGSRFMPGYWVFPGGRVEPGDGDGEERWRAAAVREVAEEVAVRLVPATLVPFDRWLTPEGLPVRFDTTFFLAPVAGDVVGAADAHEVVATRWATPGALLREAAEGAPIMSYPTLRQLERLAAFPTSAEAVRACGGPPPGATITTVRLVHGLPAMEVADEHGVPRRFYDGPVRANELAPGAGSP